VRALAHDPVRQRLWAVDDATDHLVALDIDEEGLHVEPALEALGRADVHALHFDEATDTLLGVDRQTRELLAIDRDTGRATRIAALDADDVGDMAMVPGSAVVWLACRTRVVAVDRFRGGLPDPALGLALQPADDGAADVRLLWPRGNVTRDALASCAIEVRPGTDGRLDFELACDGEVLHRGIVDADQLLARVEIPEAVRDELATGRDVTWRVGTVSAAFHVVDGADAHARIDRLLAQPAMAARTDLERRLARAYLLDRSQLHSEALQVGLATYETFPEQRLAALSLLRTLDHLGLVGTRFGEEVRLKAGLP
jgi:hypothetical protein